MSSRLLCLSQWWCPLSSPPGWPGFFIPFHSTAFLIDVLGSWWCCSAESQVCYYRHCHVFIYLCRLLSGKLERHKLLISQNLPLFTQFYISEMLCVVYILVSIAHEDWCWKNKSLELEVLEEDVSGVEFRQTGYMLRCSLSHAITLVCRKQMFFYVFNDLVKAGWIMFGIKAFSWLWRVTEHGTLMFRVLQDLSFTKTILWC